MGPEGRLFNIRQGDGKIEEYARHFLGVARQSAMENTCLMVVFWGGLAEPFKSRMPYWVPEELLEDYINLALNLSGSAFRVELAAEPATVQKLTEPIPEPAPVQEPTEPTPFREPTESTPEPAPFREPTESAPEPAPFLEPTESAPEPAPFRELTESAPEPAPFRELTESAPEPAPFREPTQSAPFREPTHSAPFREPTQSAPFREPTQSAPEPAPLRELSESTPEPAPFREPTESAPEPAPFREPTVRSRATLAPLCAHCSRPSSTSRAWPTSLLDIFLFSVCGASGICSLKGGLCHGPAGVPRLATRCLCVLSTWLVVCWCHVLPCRLSVPSHLVT